MSSPSIVFRVPADVSSRVNVTKSAGNLWLNYTGPPNELFVLSLTVDFVERADCRLTADHILLFNAPDGDSQQLTSLTQYVSIQTQSNVFTVGKLLLSYQGLFLSLLEMNMVFSLMDLCLEDNSRLLKIVNQYTMSRVRQKASAGYRSLQRMEPSRRQRALMVYMSGTTNIAVFAACLFLVLSQQVDRWVVRNIGKSAAR